MGHLGGRHRGCRTGVAATFVAIAIVFAAPAALALEPGPDAPKGPTVAQRWRRLRQTIKSVMRARALQFSAKQQTASRPERSANNKDQRAAAFALGHLEKAEVRAARQSVLREGGGAALAALALGLLPAVTTQIALVGGTAAHALAWGSSWATRRAAERGNDATGGTRALLTKVAAHPWVKSYAGWLEASPPRKWIVPTVAAGLGLSLSGATLHGLVVGGLAAVAAVTVGAHAYNRWQAMRARAIARILIAHRDGHLGAVDRIHVAWAATELRRIVLRDKARKLKGRDESERNREQEKLANERIVEWLKDYVEEKISDAAAEAFTGDWTGALDALAVHPVDDIFLPEFLDGIFDQLHLGSKHVDLDLDDILDINLF